MHVDGGVPPGSASPDDLVPELRVWIGEMNDSTAVRGMSVLPELTAVTAELGDGPRTDELVARAITKVMRDVLPDDLDDPHRKALQHLARLHGGRTSEIRRSGANRALPESEQSYSENVRGFIQTREPGLVTELAHLLWSYEQTLKALERPKSSVDHYPSVYRFESFWDMPAFDLLGSTPQIAAAIQSFLFFGSQYSLDLTTPDGFVRLETDDERVVHIWTGVLIDAEPTDSAPRRNLFRTSSPEAGTPHDAVRMLESAGWARQGPGLFRLSPFLDARGVAELAVHALSRAWAADGQHVQAWDFPTLGTHYLARRFAHMVESSGGDWAELMPVVQELLAEADRLDCIPTLVFPLKGKATRLTIPPRGTAMATDVSPSMLAVGEELGWEVTELSFGLEKQPSLLSRVPPKAQEIVALLRLTSAESLAELQVEVQPPRLDWRETVESALAGSNL
jgi:hypothetical protein